MFIWAAKISAVVTPLAMAAQAVVPLEETALLLLLPSDTLNSDIPQLQFQSAFHQGLQFEREKKIVFYFLKNFS